MKRMRVTALSVRAQYLYHVTDSKNLPDIAAEGLAIEEGGALSKGQHKEYSQDKIFLTDKDTIPNWEYYVKEMTYPDDDPAVLRVNTDYLEEILVDEKGTHDAPKLIPFDYNKPRFLPDPDPTTFSYYTEENIPPEAIEVQTPEGWVALAAHQIRAFEWLNYVADVIPGEVEAERIIEKMVVNIADKIGIDKESLATEQKNTTSILSKIENMFETNPEAFDRLLESSFSAAQPDDPTQFELPPDVRNLLDPAHWEFLTEEDPRPEEDEEEPPKVKKPPEVRKPLEVKKPVKRKKQEPRSIYDEFGLGTPKDQPKKPVEPSSVPKWEPLVEQPKKKPKERKVKEKEPKVKEPRPPKKRTPKKHPPAPPKPYPNLIPMEEPPESVRESEFWRDDVRDVLKSKYIDPVAAPQVINFMFYVVEQTHPAPSYEALKNEIDFLYAYQPEEFTEVLNTSIEMYEKEQQFGHVIERPEAEPLGFKDYFELPDVELGEPEDPLKGVQVSEELKKYLRTPIDELIPYTGPPISQRSNQIKRMRTRAEANLQTKLIQLKPQMANAAQKVYDEWEQDEEGIDEVFGAGGPCDQIADAIAGVIVDNIDVNITEGGHEGDDHAWTIAYTNTEAYGIDIPPETYEEGGGYRWTKLKDVKFTPEDVEIFPLHEFLEDILEEE